VSLCGETAKNHYREEHRDGPGSVCLAGGARRTTQCRGQGSDRIKQAAETIYQALIDAELTALIGAGLTPPTWPPTSPSSSSSCYPPPPKRSRSRGQRRYRRNLMLRPPPVRVAPITPANAASRRNSKRFSTGRTPLRSNVEGKHLAGRPGHLPALEGPGEIAPQRVVTLDRAARVGVAVDEGRAVDHRLRAPPPA
jgi:hypothetical protein